MVGTGNFVRVQNEICRIVGVSLAMYDLMFAHSNAITSQKKFHKILQRGVLFFTKICPHVPNLVQIEKKKTIRSTSSEGFHAFLHTPRNTEFVNSVALSASELAWLIRSL